jgi:alpha-galactosidase
MLFVFLLLCLAQAALGWQQHVAPTPPMGWSTWCTESGILPCFDDFCNEKEILNVANHMKSEGLLALGYNHILLDDCWAAKERINGKITGDKIRFPNGMKNFTAQLHALGFKLGLYTDVGEKTCRGGRLGSWPYYQNDAETFALDWEIDYVKMDWCQHPDNQSAVDLYTNFSQALQSTGRDVFFSTCEWGKFDVWKWAPAIANLWRSGPGR